MKAPTVYVILLLMAFCTRLIPDEVICGQKFRRLSRRTGSWRRNVTSGGDEKRQGWNNERQYERFVVSHGYGRFCLIPSNPCFQWQAIDLSANFAVLS